jgi:FkbM family methyltransferase
MKTIYDIGANNGDDIPYYLLSADKVVAVEANPDLCNMIRSRFESEIRSGKLFLVNAVVSAAEVDEATFYIHKHNHVLSSVVPEHGVDNYNAVKLPARTVTSIIKDHGCPHYVKIDIEGLDYQILKSLFDDEIYPPYISAEIHSLNVFYLIAQMPGYCSYKLVEGATVSSLYGNAVVATMDNGSTNYQFPFHSAGPYGNDIAGPWYSSEDMHVITALYGIGWKDLHASREDSPVDSGSVRPSSYLESTISTKGCILLLISKMKSLGLWLYQRLLSSRRSGLSSTNK